MEDFLVSSKTAIRQELDAVTKLAVFNFSLENPLPSETIQSLCNVIEAIFIHGLKEAFFLKSSRYSKYPEPNFWPFVSKFTHKSIKHQISTLKQIKNEVGKARAWIRIVLSEGALESYTNLLLKDQEQLRSFYMKSAFIRDQEKMDAFNGYLKALQQINIVSQPNSSLLNSWTPTPLILAGLTKGRPNRVTQLSDLNKRNVSSNSLDLDAEEAEEVGTNAVNLLDDNNHFENIFSIVKKFGDDDEKSSVYSHPSMLDGAMNSFLRPTFVGLLASTPENCQASDVVIPSEELSAEVIVHRKRTRFRQTSKSSSDRSRSQSINKAVNEPAVSKNIENMQLEDNLSDEILSNDVFNDIAACSSSCDVPFDFKSDDGRNDSGIEQNDDEKGSSPVLSPDNMLNLEHQHQTSLKHAIFDISTKGNAEFNPYEISYMSDKDRGFSMDDTKLFGTSLHDELNFSLNKEPKILATSDLSFALDSAETIGRTNSWNINSPKHVPEKQLSCSSSTGTDFSVPISNLDTALKNFVKKSEKHAAEVESSASSQLDSQAQTVEILRKSDNVPSSSFEPEMASKKDVVVIEEKSLEVTDEYGSTPQKMLLLNRIPTEKGLSSQDFRCPSCQKSIGGSFGSFKLCNLDGCYYCEDCLRRGDESIIPSRVILNWDCKPRSICKASKLFLKSIADNPLLRIDKLNPCLYEHSRPMKKILNMRTKLSLAVMYLLSCKQSIAEDIKRRASSNSQGLWPSDYLYADIHLYSITDLENVISGSLERRLNSLITFTVNHIFNCPLCLQKGFFCELCSSKHLIYPFQIEIAHRCKACFSVFHIKCINKNSSGCPKCLRRHAKNSFSSKINSA